MLGRSAVPMFGGLAMMVMRVAAIAVAVRIMWAVVSGCWANAGELRSPLLSGMLLEASLSPELLEACLTLGGFALVSFAVELFRFGSGAEAEFAFAFGRAFH